MPTGKGTYIEVGDGETYGESSIFEKLACCYDFAGGGRACNVIEGIPCNDDEDTPREPGDTFSKPVTFTCQYSAANEKYVDDLVGVKRGWFVQVNSGAKLPFTGFVNDYSPSYPRDGFSVFDVEIAIDGRIGRPDAS